MKRIKRIKIIGIAVVVYVVAMIAMFICVLKYIEKKDSRLYREINSQISDFFDNQHTFVEVVY